MPQMPAGAAVPSCCQVIGAGGDVGGEEDAAGGDDRIAVRRVVAERIGVAEADQVACRIVRNFRAAIHAVVVEEHPRRPAAAAEAAEGVDDAVVLGLHIEDVAAVRGCSSPGAEPGASRVPKAPESCWPM